MELMTDHRSKGTPMSRTLAVLLAVAAVARADKPAADQYAFAIPPLEVLDRLAKTDLGPIPAPAAADRAFIDAVWAVRRSQEYTEKGDYDGSLKVLATTPKDFDLHDSAQTQE
jgi:hypothetical protein